MCHGVHLKIKETMPTETLETEYIVPLLFHSYDGVQ